MILIRLLRAECLYRRRNNVLAERVNYYLRTFARRRRRRRRYAFLNRGEFSAKSPGPVGAARDLTGPCQIKVILIPGTRARRIHARGHYECKSRAAGPGDRCPIE